MLPPVETVTSYIVREGDTWLTVSHVLGDPKGALSWYDKAIAAHFEQQLRDWNIRGKWNLQEDVEAGLIPKLFYESADPDRIENMGALYQLSRFGSCSMRMPLWPRCGELQRSTG